MGKKVDTRELTDLLNRIDPTSFWAKVVWQLNVPLCSCDPCYTDWLEQGKQLYGRDKDGYRRAVEKEEFHRKQRKLNSSQPCYVGK